jgi:hypothetical protein
MQKITLNNVTVTIQKEKINPLIDGLIEQIQNMNIAELSTKVDAIYDLLSNARYIDMVSQFENDRLITSFCFPLLKNIFIITRNDDLVIKFNKKMILIMWQNDTPNNVNLFFFIHKWLIAKGMSSTAKEEMLKLLTDMNKKEDNISSLPIFVIGKPNSKYDSYKVVTDKMISTHNFIKLFTKYVLDPMTIKQIDDIGSEHYLFKTISIENHSLHVWGKDLHCSDVENGSHKISYLRCDECIKHVYVSAKKWGESDILLFIRSDIICI